MSKLTLTGIARMTEEQFAKITVEDDHKMTDLELCLHNNDERTYRAIEALAKNYKRKIEKDQFNYGLGVKGCLNIVDMFIQESYIKDFCSRGTRISDLVNVEERIYLANQLMQTILGMITEF